jgi:hypothetical protein
MLIRKESVVVSDIVQCDFCDRNSSGGRMVKCIGCGKDLCRHHVAREDWCHDPENVVFVCADCRPSFCEMNSKTADIIENAHAEAESILSAWKIYRRLGGSQ